MAWFNVFQSQDRDLCNAWGHTFLWTEEHLTPEQAYPLKFSYDEMGEQALERLSRISLASSTVLPPPGSIAIIDGKEEMSDAQYDSGKIDEKQDLYVLLRENADNDEVLGRFWKEVTTVPEWVDW
ncbi:hypothetical protein MMC12_007927 [Toensbergia leucococca]|nr:hypothetical protein [Toensbergia leucococca]